MRIVDSLMAEVDKGNIRAIELAMRRHPHLRKTFREEPAVSKTELEFELHQDKNKDVIEERTKQFWAELEQRRLKEPATSDLITVLQERGYEVFKKSDLHSP